MNYSHTAYERDALSRHLDSDAVEAWNEDHAPIVYIESNNAYYDYSTKRFISSEVGKKAIERQDRMREREFNPEPERDYDEQ